MTSATAATSATASVASLGIPPHLQHFLPSHAAALKRIDAIDPAQYARSRNALDGAVTGLSPYLTHGMVGTAEVARAIQQRSPLSFDDKLVFELGWREFFHHVWSRAPLGGDGILNNMHGEPPWRGHYKDTLPLDIREGRTGVPVIDNAVRVLYATGYLHNHVRMWLASYTVHVRKVHWRAGADWLYGHLLDGDLPSNHLSWQWVAATFSSKPYLFNAENVRKYAPVAARAAWDSAGTVIDTSYEALDVLAREKGDAGPERGQHDGVTEPALHHHVNETFLRPFMPVAGVLHTCGAIDNITNKAVELIHPWALSAGAADAPSPQRFRLGVLHAPAHGAWPWSAQRWQFVLPAMAAVTDAVWVGDLAALNLSGAASVTAQACLFPGYRQALAAQASLHSEPRLLANPAMACRSFSKFYDRARRDVAQFSDLL